MSAVRFVAVLFALAAAPFWAGCKSACRQLSERTCQCITTTIERDACYANAAAQESLHPPDADQDDTCEALLPDCNCFLIGTPDGKRACGLAENDTVGS